MSVLFVLLLFFLFLICYSFQEPGIVPVPNEIDGNFIGQYEAIVDGNQIKGCSIFLQTKQGFGVFMNPSGSCDEYKGESLHAFIGTTIKEGDIYPGYIYKVVCEDIGQGYLLIRNQIGYLCVRFIRKGDTLTLKNGFIVGTQSMLECPASASSMPGQDPKILGMSTLKATGITSKSITKKQFTCNA